VGENFALSPWRSGVFQERSFTLIVPEISLNPMAELKLQFNGSRQKFGEFFMLLALLSLFGLLLHEMWMSDFDSNRWGSRSLFQTS
jgi:hypothetical protein